MSLDNLALKKIYKRVAAKINTSVSEFERTSLLLRSVILSINFIYQLFYNVFTQGRPLPKIQTSSDYLKIIYDIVNTYASAEEAEQVPL